MSIKVAFWSRSPVCDTETHMLLLAYLYAKHYPKTQVLVQNQGMWHSVQRGQGDDKILFADCGNAQDKKTYNSLKKADLIIMSAHPTQEDLDYYFVEKRQEFAGKRIVLIGNYKGETVADNQNVRTFYRIDDLKTGWVPYNVELQFAKERGILHSFIQANLHDVKVERNRIFFKEMERNLFLLAKQLENLEYMEE